MDWDRFCGISWHSDWTFSKIVFQCRSTKQYVINHEQWLDVSSGKGCTCEMWNVKCLPELKWRCHCRTVAPTRIGIPPARFDLSYFSVLLLEICFVRSTLGDCEVTRTSMMWRRHLLNMARYYLKLHCCCHLDELKFLLVMGQFLKSKGPESLWGIFANFLTFDPAEREPGAKLDPLRLHLSHHQSSLQLLLHQLLLL